MATITNPNKMEIQLKFFEQPNENLMELYEQLSKYGKIVDLNMEHFPYYLIITYTSHQSVLDMLKKHQKVQMDMLTLEMSKCNFQVHIRNIKTHTGNHYLQFAPQ
jgi:hypothetical protein